MTKMLGSLGIVYSGRCARLFMKRGQLNPLDLLGEVVVCVPTPVRMVS